MATVVVVAAVAVNGWLNATDDDTSHHRRRTLLSSPSSLCPNVFPILLTKEETTKADAETMLQPHAPSILLRLGVFQLFRKIFVPVAARSLQLLTNIQSTCTSFRRLIKKPKT